MTSSRCSRITTLAVLSALLLAAVAVSTAAVAVDDTSVPSEAEAGTQISASFTLTDLYLEPSWDPWTLQGETELTNVTWTVTFIDATGNEFDTRSYDGQQLNGSAGVEISTERDVDRVRVEMVGQVPTPEEFTYPEEETFLVAELVQTRGEQGSQNAIDSWEAHHYTAGEGDSAGSQEARQAISEAESAIESADEAGADVSDAEDSLENAQEFYELGEFDNAVEQAEQAEQRAVEAQESQESSRQTRQLLLAAGAVVLVLAVLGGGYWWYQQQQDDYDKLG